MQDLEKKIASWAAGKKLVGRIWLFGSRARGDHRPDSDIDLAIELDVSCISGVDESGGFATWTFEVARWRKELQQQLEVTVDLQLYDGSNTPTIHAALNRSSMLLYTKQ